MAFLWRFDGVFYDVFLMAFFVFMVIFYGVFVTFI